MTSALIGYTGFVGSNLAREHDFDVCVNSKSIGDMTGGSYDLVVCAGVSAVKWMANKDPDADRVGIAGLTDVLATIQAKRFVLLSTIDVFKSPVGVDETTPVDTDGLHPYGLHRHGLETWIKNRFDHSTVVRLPALFGTGLRKNIIYDLIHDNMLEAIQPQSRFQWYPVARLWSDLQVAIAADTSLVHLATEPFATADILTRFFPDKAVGGKSGGVATYDFHTAHSDLFGKTGPYMMSQQEVMDALSVYLQGAEGAAP